MIPAKDISRWQGPWTDTGEPIYLVKISGGDTGLYIDPDASTNYNQTIAAGKAFGGYHFAGGTDPVAEANFYLNAMQPWNPGEVPILDWEIQHTDPVGWCLQFATQVHNIAGAWPLIYMNLSTLRAYDWTPVLAVCGLWLADWTGNPDSVINVGYNGYVMLQYNDGPNYDHDEWEYDIPTFRRYGWPNLQPTPTSTTTTDTTSTTTSSSSSSSSTSTTSTQSTSTSTTTTILPPIIPPNETLVSKIIRAIVNFIRLVIGVKK